MEFLQSPIHVYDLLARSLYNEFIYPPDHIVLAEEAMSVEFSKDLNIEIYSLVTIHLRRHQHSRLSQIQNILSLIILDVVVHEKNTNK